MMIEFDRWQGRVTTLFSVWQLSKRFDASNKMPKGLSRSQLVKAVGVSAAYLLEFGGQWS